MHQTVVTNNILIQSHRKRQHQKFSLGVLKMLILYLYDHDFPFSTFQTDCDTTEEESLVHYSIGFHWKLDWRYDLLSSTFRQNTTWILHFIRDNYLLVISGADSNNSGPDAQTRPNDLTLGYQTSDSVSNSKFHHWP